MANVYHPTSMQFVFASLAATYIMLFLAIVIAPLSRCAKQITTTMANVYYQTSMQLVFAVKNRDALITDNLRDTLHKYIGGILKNKKHKPLAINSMPDHIHIFFGMHPCDIPALVRDIKSDSSTYINQNKLSKSTFNWQKGYGLFSYTMSDRPRVIRYVENQQNHHKKKTFKEEYLYILQKFDIEHNDDYLFNFFD